MPIGIAVAPDADNTDLAMPGSASLGTQAATSGYSFIDTFHRPDSASVVDAPNFPYVPGGEPWAISGDTAVPFSPNTTESNQFILAPSVAAVIELDFTLTSANGNQSINIFAGIDDPVGAQTLVILQLTGGVDWTFFCYLDGVMHSLNGGVLSGGGGIGAHSLVLTIIDPETVSATLDGFDAGTHTLPGTLTGKYHGFDQSASDDGSVAFATRFSITAA